MPMAEFNQWVEFHKIEPFGPYFDDLRSASIAAAIYNVNRDPARAPEPIYPSQLVPWNALHRRYAEPEKPKEFSTPKDQEAAVLSMVAKVVAP
jgi:hypothetical protein